MSFNVSGLNISSTLSIVFQPSRHRTSPLSSIISVDRYKFNMFVLPGDVTGDYYIVVCNLRWNTKWQDLKDFARYHPDGSCLNVDHAFISSNGHSGWVRIKGKEDFRKALGRFPSALC
jgi:hypothetical protein